jgi:CRISPR/Cas system-associated endonuclease Cas3-HD
MDRDELLNKAAAWMIERGWKQKLAKSHPIQQSLFEHSLIELDVLLELLPILSATRHYGLSDEEQQIMLVAVLIHDAGKESDAWQEYIREPLAGRWVSHINPEISRGVALEVCSTLGYAYRQHRPFPEAGLFSQSH